MAFFLQYQPVWILILHYAENKLGPMSAKAMVSKKTASHFWRRYRETLNRLTALYNLPWVIVRGVHVGTHTHHCNHRITCVAFFFLPISIISPLFDGMPEEIVPGDHSREQLLHTHHAHKHSFVARCCYKTLSGLCRLCNYTETRFLHTCILTLECQWTNKSWENKFLKRNFGGLHADPKTSKNSTLTSIKLFKQYLHNTTYTCSN